MTRRQKRTKTRRPGIPCSHCGEALSSVTRTTQRGESASSLPHKLQAGTESRMMFSLNLSERRGQMRRMLSRIFAEPIEIAFASELGVEVDPAVSGLTSTTLSSLIREKTPDAWTEHRAAMLIADAHLRGLDPVEAGIMFDATVLHEAAHILTVNHVSVDVPAAPLAELIKTPHVAWPDYATGPRWITHDCRFIRALIHIADRLESRKCRVFISQAFQHERYGLSPIETYVAALNGEPQETDLMPLREVLARPMPNEFFKLWGRDVASSLGLKPQ